eukprot:365387-Chlamydomonas_euryale.AAC.13
MCAGADGRPRAWRSVRLARPHHAKPGFCVQPYFGDAWAALCIKYIVLKFIKLVPKSWSGGCRIRYLNRPFGRVDRPKLKRKMLAACKEHGVTFLKKGVESVTHAGGSSTVKMADGSTLQV